jgi:hypothetical protein
MDERAIDPERCAGSGETHPFDPSTSDRRPGNALVEPRRRDAFVGNRSQQPCDRHFGDIIKL